MVYAGIDIGSRSIELVLVDDAGVIQQTFQADTGFDPMQEVNRLLSDVQYQQIMATGYGRNLFELSFDARTVTEIRAHAVGVRAYYPNVETIVDIGGQDSKVIALFSHGKVKKFEMNDRCAAGTGKFLEIMAKALGYTLEQFSQQALLASEAVNISSMCTVFAESEVTSLIGRGEARDAIAKGLHNSVIRRIKSMINRVSDSGDIVFSGGVANNPCMVQGLAAELGRRILVPDSPQMMGALGAALLAREADR